jgi:hypothetical protein
MKTITNEIKAKYFSLYYYRQVLGKYINSDELDPIDIMNPCEVDYIELTPIEQISDEDARKCISFLYPNKNIKNIIINESGMNFKWKASYSYLSGLVYFNHLINIKVYQYLLSKGYALPYMDYSVSDLVENGTIKFKTK